MKSLFGSPFDKCLSELRKLQAVRAGFATRMLADESQLAALKARVPDLEFAALLEDEGAAAGAASLRRDVREIEDRIAGRATAKSALRRKITETLKAMGKARAENLRKDAEKLQAELTAHCAEMDRRVDELNRFAGCRFVIDKSDQVPAGRPFIAGEYGWQEPKFTGMDREVARLKSNALRIEEQASFTRGGVSVETIEELLAITNDIQRLAPTEPEIRSWYAAQLVAADEAWKLTVAEYRAMGYQQIPAPDRALILSVFWDDFGNILPESSVKNRVCNVVGLYRETPGAIFEPIRGLPESQRGIRQVG
jgi:hypothetical protein